MNSRKLIVTHRGRLVKKYGTAGADTIDAAVAALAAADTARGLETHYVHLDVAGEVQPFGATPVSSTPAASRCKKAIDTIFPSLTPDYLVLLGSDDVMPHFRVPNPVLLRPGGDGDEKVPTDNPYATSLRFDPSSRASYLIPDRVIGRIPDVPGATDASVLLHCLDAATTASPMNASAFTLDLLISCDFWKTSASACVTALGRNQADLFLSGPTLHNTPAFANRHQARLQMIRCHGAPLDPRFYGEDSFDTPEVLSAGALTGRTQGGTVVGAACCYGASVYDPEDLGALRPGVPSIPTVYLDQRAAGFVGSTCITYLESTNLTAADWIVTRFLQNAMAGDSLGRALLNAKQQFATDIRGAGKNFQLTEEKALLQFLLLGDPSVRAILPSDMLHAAAVLPEGARPKLSLSLAERRSRREVHALRARELREVIPDRVETEPRLVATAVLTDEELKQFGAMPPTVQWLTPRKRRSLSLERALWRDAPVPTAFGAETLQYYWFLRTPREKIIDIKVVMVETDLEGNILRKQSLVSA